MIDLQYNFPLLPGQAELFRLRLRAAVDALPDTPATLRPSFRADHTAALATAAQWLRQPADRTLLTVGNHHGTLVALLAARLAGQPIAVDAASYTGALTQSRMLDCPLIPIPVDAEGMTATGLATACEAARTAGRPLAAAFVFPTVHNPLGCVASLARRTQLIAVAEAFDLLLIEDDAYGFMAPDAPPPLATLAPDRTFYIRGLAKSFAPASRIGFLVVPERFLDAARAALQNTTSGVSLPHLHAAISMLEDGTLNQIVAAKLIEGGRRNAAARALLAAASPGQDLCWPGAPAAWHLWINLPASVTPQSFEATMSARGVAVSGGNWFTADPTTQPPPPHGLRVALGGELDPTLAQQGIALVAEQLLRLKNSAS